MRDGGLMLDVFKLIDSIADLIGLVLIIYVLWLLNEIRKGVWKER